MEADTEWTGDDYKKYTVENPKDRLGFIRKVYSILTLQLLITSFFVLASVLSENYQDFVYDAFWTIIIAFILCIVIMIVLFFVKDLHRRVPYNYILMIAFTVIFGFLVSCTTAFYSPGTILIAAGCTFGLTFALTVYAFTTKTDFTALWGYMIAISFGLLVLGLLFIVFGTENAYRLVFCPIAVACYGVYLVYDTQLIVGQKRHKIGYDDYILGAVALYVDVVGIFIYILSIFGRK
jgi:protein lifeguard